ncbi:hypothetical protein CIG1485E_a0059 (plasmid) [Campylobacter iguaniorum]|jgi:hypothetical protein|uniref:Uncharacterized protein n=1 Tax=Campylobacter iguaniorum TaxID=1244531 RepID=A0A076FI93_9BACT|nr:hypothetical protein [Campylobacter iguaniorum]AII15584.1 hypothetical protein CIG1485E_a0059 [Campylobacter iguaniorum]
MNELYIWHFAGIVLVVMLSQFKNRLLDKGGIWSVFFWGIMDTLPHETAHWIVASLTGGRPYGFSIIPKKIPYVDASGQDRILWDFGSVQAYVSFYNAAAIGMAPLMLLGGAFLTYTYYFEFMPNEWWSILLFYWILYILIANSMPSTQDFKVALSQNSWLFYLIFIGIGFIAYEYVIKELINKGGI